jgi:Flp pilus assembly protein TadD
LCRFRSLLVSLLFALHPLNVEVVAWLSARKDLISMTTTLIVLMAYCRYARQPRLGRYGLLLGAYGVAAMTKPVVIVVPALLFLLDHWPLQRRDPLRTRLIEKVPLFAIAFGVAVLAWRAQSNFNAIQGLDISPIPRRFLNVVLNYSVYLQQMVWPRALSVFYPISGEIPVFGTIVRGLGLACFSGFVLWWRERLPQIFVGWFWFILALSPVIGWVGLGSSRTADRYMYLAGIGVLMGVVFLPWETWLPNWFLTKLRQRACRFACFGMFMLVVAAGAFATFQQAQVWASSVTVFSQARRLYPHDPTINLQLALGFLDEGQNAKAVSLSLEVIATKPKDAKAWRIMGTALGHLGHANEAKKALGKAIFFDPTLTVAYLDLSKLEADSGNTKEAIDALTRATLTTPNYAETYYRRALIFCSQERWEEALSDLQFLVELRPRNPQYALLLARTAFAAGKEDLAREVLRKSADLLAANPELVGDVEALQRMLARPEP